MSETAQFETDEFLKLLTDALRAGPASPQWHDAVTRLRDAGSSEADEYRLLISAREHLENGREFRSVRAGPGFTRKVMDGLEREASRPRKGMPAASVIFLLGMALILVAVVSVAVILLKSDNPARTVQDLRAGAFSSVAISSTFSQAISAEWKTFGVSPEVRGGALYAGKVPESAEPAAFKGGGIVSTASFTPEQPIEIDLTAAVEEATDQLVLQLFVTDAARFDGAAEATTPSELAVNLRKNELVVVKPDGNLVGEPGRYESRKNIHLTVKLDAAFIIVADGAGRELYAGEHGLSRDKPRWVGMRFLTTGRAADQISVQSVRVMKP